jgi:hypothetical protein
MDKVKLARIWIDWIEGDSLTLPGTVHRRFDEFNAALARLASRAALDNIRERVMFSVEWADGRRLQTRLDLERQHAAGGPIAEQHVRRRLEFYCGRWRPQNLTTEQYAEVLGLLGEESENDAQQILDGYQLADEGTAAEYRNMNDARFADFIADAICGMLANVSDAPRARIRSFADAGIDGNAGLVVFLGGAEYKVAITRGMQ